MTTPMSASDTLTREYLGIRSRLLDVAAALDRIDHCEEHTVRPALDEGYWAGITLHPTTKATPERA